MSNIPSRKARTRKTKAEGNIGLADEIDNDELIEALDNMESDNTVEIVSKIRKANNDEDEDSEEAFDKIVDSEDEDMEEEIEDIEEKPKSRWLMTTCLYCGNIYRFRSDQPQPLTCGKPQCIARFDEFIQKRARAVAKV